LAARVPPGPEQVAEHMTPAAVRQSVRRGGGKPGAGRMLHPPHVRQRFGHEMSVSGGDCDDRGDEV